MTNTQQIQTLKAHLAINVKDVERSINFYRNLFGIEPSKVRTGYAKFDVQNPPLNFTLNEAPFNETGALSHLGIQVASTEDVLAMRERWQERGLITKDEMNTSCCYAVQDKTWVSDPDGNEWEVFVVLQDNLPETDPCACGIKLAEASAEEIPVKENKNVETAVSCCAPQSVSISINREETQSCSVN